MQEDLWRGLQPDSCRWSPPITAVRLQGQKEVGRELSRRSPTACRRSRRDFICYGKVACARKALLVQCRGSSTWSPRTRQSCSDSTRARGPWPPVRTRTLLVWDPNREQSLNCASLHMRVDYSPTKGRWCKALLAGALPWQGHHRRRQVPSDTPAKGASCVVRPSHRSRRLYGFLYHPPEAPGTSSCGAQLTITRQPLVLVDGKGCYVTDIDGRKSSTSLVAS